MKIKQLEWIRHKHEPHNGYFYWTSWCYKIEQHNKREYFMHSDHYHINEDDGYSSSSLNKTLKEAKQGAQQHFEQFIRSCIDED